MGSKHTLKRQRWHSGAGELPDCALVTDSPMAKQVCEKRRLLVRLDPRAGAGEMALVALKHESADLAVVNTGSGLRRPEAVIGSYMPSRRLRLVATKELADDPCLRHRVRVVDMTPPSPDEVAPCTRAAWEPSSLIVKPMTWTVLPNFGRRRSVGWWRHLLIPKIPTIGSSTVSVFAWCTRSVSTLPIGPTLGQSRPASDQSLPSATDPAMKAAQTIVLVRHAVKPSSVGVPFGVDEAGEIDPHNLTVRGWQRAGALCQLFRFGRADFSIGRPTALFAAATSASSPSTRCFSTVKPLAGALGLSLDDSFGKGDEQWLAQEISGRSGTVVVAWEHKALPALARALVGASCRDVPSSWPDERFDVAWVITRDAAGATCFAQIPQLLLDGDCTDQIGA